MYSILGTMIFRREEVQMQKSSKIWTKISVLGFHDLFFFIQKIMYVPLRPKPNESPGESETPASRLPSLNTISHSKGPRAIWRDGRFQVWVRKHTQAKGPEHSLQPMELSVKDTDAGLVTLPGVKDEGVWTSRRIVRDGLKHTRHT